MKSPFAQNAREAYYIEAMSRGCVVSAYARWTSLSTAERLCFTHFLPKHARILDLGCGTGRALAALNGNFRSYLGVDASKAMIRCARRNHPGARFKCSDIVDFTSNEVSVDAVLLLHNVIDMLNPRIRRAHLLQNVMARLTPGGVLIASSHLRQKGRSKGYFKEEYHGVTVTNYRSSFAEWCSEIEAAGLIVLFEIRDFRGLDCDWAYIVATKA